MSVCNKGSSTIGYRANWCVSHDLQSNQFISRPVEEEEKEDGDFDQFPCTCITVACILVLLDRESLVNHV